MAQPAWAKLSTGNSEAVITLQDIKDSAGDVITAVETVVSTAKAVADLILTFYVDLGNIELELIKTAIGTLRESLQDLLTGAGAYMLLVPMRVVDPLEWTGNPEMFYLGNRDTKSLPHMETVKGPEYVNQPDDGAAGNYGFYSQVRESLDDRLDVKRPEFDQDAYVTSLVLLFGSSTFMELVIMAKKLMRLFDFPGVELAPDTVPTPRGLRATIVPVPLSKGSVLAEHISGNGDFSTQPYGVRIDWDTDEKDWLLAAYGNVRFEIDKAILYRWVDGEYTPEQIRANAYPAAKIWEVEYSGLVSMVIDTDITPGTTYQYGLSYTYNVLDADGNTTQTVEPPNVDMASLRVPVPENIRMGAGAGVPPDWVASPLIPAIPGLGKAIAFLVSWLDRVEKSITTGKDDIEEFIKFLQRELDRYTGWSRQLTATIQEAIDALTWPSVYAGAWFMPPHKGGNNYFMTQLGSALFDKAGTDRPPFDLGTEAVTGVVLYVGAETPGKLEKFASTVNLLFGSMVDTATTTGNALEEAIKEMNAVLTETGRQLNILDDLTVGAVAEIEEELNTTVGANLEPTTESATCSNAALDAKFGE